MDLYNRGRVRFTSSVNIAVKNAEDLTPALGGKYYISGADGLTEYSGGFPSTLPFHSITITRNAGFGPATADEIITEYDRTAYYVDFQRKIANTPFDIKLKSFSAEMFVALDAFITEADNAVVDAYTAIDTAAQFHDRAKAWLVDNYTGQTAPIVTREGDTIDADALNVVVDKAAAAAFAVDGNTITIKADTFTGNLKTTGAVTALNGASVAGGIIDANGDSFLRFDGIDSWAVYAAATDRDAGTNALGTGSSADTYRFNYSADTPLYLRLTVSGETLFKDTTPQAAGETAVSLNTAAQLAVLAKDVKETRDHARGANVQTEGG